MESMDLQEEINKQKKNKETKTWGPMPRLLRGPGHGAYRNSGRNVATVDDLPREVLTNVLDFAGPRAGRFGATSRGNMAVTEEYREGRYTKYMITNDNIIEVLTKVESQPKQHARTVTFVVTRFTPFVKTLFSRLCKTGIGRLAIYFNADDYNGENRDVKSTVRTLIEYARVLHTLHLDFSGNKIGDIGVRHLTKLIECHALKKLKLQLEDNMIGDAGALAIGIEWYKSHFEELWLGLSTNGIGSDGATHLAFLKSTPTLVRLVMDLDWNLFIFKASPGTHALIEYPNGPSLRVLLISNEPYGLLVEKDRFTYKGETYGYMNRSGHTYAEYFQRRGLDPSRNRSANAHDAVYAST
jgi:hypothetical protein